MSKTLPKQMDIIATLGPASFSEPAMEKLVQAGASIFRINGAQAEVDLIESSIQKIRRSLGTRVKILLDLPGNKVRLRGLPENLCLKIGDEIELARHQVNYDGFFKLLKVGETLLTNDGLTRLEVIRVQNGEKALLRCLSEGEFKNKRGLHTSRSHPLPFLFDKDRELLKLSRRCGLDYLGLSFVRTHEDVLSVQEFLSGSGVKKFVKIETWEAVENLDAILFHSDQILIDRGDLCAAIPYTTLPAVQEAIMKKARAAGVKVALATQFLYSMVTRNTPLISEIEALYGAIAAGTDAIQLSEETSIGRYPVEAVRVVAAIREEVYGRQASEKKTFVYE